MFRRPSAQSRNNFLTPTGTSAIVDLGSETRGFALNFLDMSYIIRAPLGAELMGGEEGFYLDFVDYFGPSYAIRDE